MGAPSQSVAIHVRQLVHQDHDDIVRIDALHTGDSKPEYWRDVLESFLDPRPGPLRIGLAAEKRGRLIGYLFGEVRAFEFGSEACGWVFAVGVHRDSARAGVGSALLEEARRLFRQLGVESVRTMVRRTDVPLLTFFRAHGFVGGPFVQLELDLEDRE